MRLYPNLVKQPVGSEVDFTCSYHSKEEMTIEFEEVPSVVVPHIGSGNGGHIGHAVQRYDWGAESVYHLRIHDSHRAVTCTVYSKEGIAMGTLKAMIHHPGLLNMKNHHSVCLFLPTSASAMEIKFHSSCFGLSCHLSE
jgi:hypothetical protein